MNLFQILSFDERIIVASRQDLGLIATWNQSLTFQAWALRDDGQWEETDIMTLSEQPRSFAAARKRAIDWLAQ